MIVHNLEMPMYREENNGTDDQANNAAPLDLETIITKMKHHHNAVTSVTRRFRYGATQRAGNTER